MLWPGKPGNPEVLSPITMGIHVLEPSVPEYLPEDRPSEVPDLVRVLLDDSRPFGAYGCDALLFEISLMEDCEQAVTALVDHGGNQTPTPAPLVAAM